MIHHLILPFQDLAVLLSMPTIRALPLLFFPQEKLVRQETIIFSRGSWFIHTSINNRKMFNPFFITVDRSFFSNFMRSFKYTYYFLNNIICIFNFINCPSYAKPDIFIKP